jgi:hypothetical protein
MRKTRIALLSLTLLAALVFTLTLVPLHAQEEMAPVVCDSTLVTLVYLAEYHYGYHPSIMMGEEEIAFDHGQFQPWFETMMAMMEEGDMMEEEEAMAEEEAMMDESMMEGVTMLTPGNIEGEDVYCSDLRADVETFLYDTISAEMMAMAEGS